MLWTDPFAPLATQLDRAAFMPAADLTVSDENLVLTLDLPGLTPEDLSIEMEDGYLTVRGERKRARVPEGASSVQAERPVGAFERRIQVPKDVDPDRIAASMEHGVLSLVVPKPARMQRRSIPIGSGSAQRRPEPTAA